MTEEHSQNKSNHTVSFPQNILERHFIKWNFKSKWVGLRDICILKRTLHTKYNTFISHCNPSLKFSISDQKVIDLDINSQNNLVKSIINQTDHKKLEGIKWNNALYFINNSLSEHRTSFELLPPSQISIGLSTIIFIIIVVVIFFVIFKRYENLTLDLNTIRVTYETTWENVGIPNDISKKEMSLCRI